MIFAAAATGHTFDDPAWIIPTIIAVPVVISVVTLYFRYRSVKRRPPREGDEATFPTGCLLAFASVFILAGLVTFFYVTARPTYRAWQAARWPTTQGSVLSSKLDSNKDSDGKSTYRVDIRYRYAVAGHEYESNQYDGTGTTLYSGDYHGKRAVVSAHRRGTDVVVYYDPADPADAMLSTAVPPGTFSFLWFPILFCTVPTGLVYLLYRSNRAAGRPRAAKRVALAPAAADARRTRRGKFIAIAIFAIVWNGFITFFWLATHTWCIVPFALIGLILAVFAGQEFLALFNPLVSVSFARMPIHPGDTCDVTFAVEGNVFSVRSLTFKLEGREKVTFRQGTDTRTESRAVYTFPLFETTKSFEMEKGKFTIKLPADVMTSFRASNNEFSWHLVCRGEMARRPDIKDEFDVTVLSRPKG